MDTVPLWLQMTSAVVGVVGGFAAIVACLWPVLVGKETLRELLGRRLSGRQAASPGGQPVPQPKSRCRAILYILALVVSLLIFGGSSALGGSLLLSRVKYIPSISSPCAQQTPPPRGEFIISGTVWNDTDNDGQWNNGEQAACNLKATISLVDDSNGKTVQTVQVNVDGGYAFSDLPSGTYSLSPSFTPTNPDQLKNISIGPDINTENVGYNG